MSNGNGVAATLSDAAESVKEKASEIGEAVASTASATVAKAKKAAKSAEKTVKTRVASANSCAGAPSIALASQYRVASAPSPTDTE